MRMTPEIEKVLCPMVLPKAVITDKKVPDRMLDEKIFQIRRNWFSEEYLNHECGNCTGVATEVALSHGCLNSTESVVANWYGHKNLTDLQA